MHVEKLGYHAWEFRRRLPQLLKGIARVYPASTRKRAPVTLSVTPVVQVVGLHEFYSCGVVGGYLTGVLWVDAEV